jgi:hypothetical protein
MQLGRWEAMEFGSGNAECGMKKDRRWEKDRRWKIKRGWLDDWDERGDD